LFDRTRIEFGRESVFADAPPLISRTALLARGLIRPHRMAKSKRRSETASPKQSAAARAKGQARGNDENARDRIALRAYELYLSRGSVHGGDFDDWIAAERELIGSSAHPGPDRGE
jgi:hypothetical protein